MIKISRVVMRRALVIALLPLSAQMTWARDGHVDAMVGGALGGVIGSIVGSQIGGRDGAVVGAGIGAMAGVAISANDGRRHDHYERARYVDERCHDEDRRKYYRHDDRGYYADRGERGWHDDDNRHRFYRD